MSNFKKVIYTPPQEVECLKCDFPTCNKETSMSCAIDNPCWCGYKKHFFCRDHFDVGKFIIDNGEKILVLHNIENTNDKIVGEIIDILPNNYYNVQWYFNGKKLSDEIESYHASVLTLIGFK